DLQRARVVGERAGVILEVVVDQRPVGVSLVRAGVERDDLIEVCKRLLVAPGTAVGGAAHIVGLWVPRAARDHGRERGDVFLGALRNVHAGHVERGTGLARGEREAGEREQCQSERACGANPAGAVAEVHGGRSPHSMAPWSAAEIGSKNGRRSTKKAGGTAAPPRSPIDGKRRKIGALSERRPSA